MKDQPCSTRYREWNDLQGQMRGALEQMEGLPRSLVLGLHRRRLFTPSAYQKASL